MHAVTIGYRPDPPHCRQTFSSKRIQIHLSSILEMRYAAAVDSSSLSKKRLGLQTNAAFDTTHWSIVLEAGGAQSERAAASLEILCRTYWHPIYSFIRWRGHSPADSKDLTQEFFSRFLESNSLQGVTPDKGRFRSFLLAAVKNFLANEWDRSRRQKRGGGKVFSIEDCNPEESHLLDPADGSTPEKAFERKWAQTVLARVLDKLEQEYEGPGKENRFEHLKAFLTDDAEGDSYAAVAARIGVSPSAVKSAVHRLRQRYLELIREEIARTVATRSQVDEELRHLYQALCD